MGIMRGLGWRDFAECPAWHTGNVIDLLLAGESGGDCLKGEGGTYGPAYQKDVVEFGEGHLGSLIFKAKGS